MKDKSYYIGNVADVIHSWMNYIYEVSDTDHLAAESSLRYPIAGLLERKKDDVSVAMEVEHPCYKDARVDFMWKNKTDSVFLEMKYVKEDSINVQDFFDDIFRLATIPEENCHKYFLVCGKIDDFKKNFERRKVSTKNAYTSVLKKKGEKVRVKQNTSTRASAFDEILSFVIQPSPQETIIGENIAEKMYCFSAKRKLYKYYQEFKKAYTKKCKGGYQCPRKITIKTILLQPINKGFTSSVAVWKIEQVECV